MSTTRVCFQERPASPHSQPGGQWAALPLRTVRWPPLLQVMPPERRPSPAALPPALHTPLWVPGDGETNARRPRLLMRPVVPAPPADFFVLVTDSVRGGK